MAKVKAGKGRGKTKATKKVAPKRKATKKVAKKKVAKRKQPARTLAKAKPKLVARAKTKRPVARSAAPRTAAKAPQALAPDVTALVLYDLICSVEDAIETGLTFGICEQRARAHNESNPGHDAQPIRRQ